MPFVDAMESTAMNEPRDETKLCEQLRDPGRRAVIWRMRIGPSCSEYENRDYKIFSE